MRSINLVAVFAGLSLLLGCNPADNSNTSTGASSGSDTSGKMTSSDEASQTNTAPNNTGVNVRDRAEGALTPMDQGSSQADRDLTARLRQAVTQDQFSTDAKNIKIITVNGKVTLRGVVKDAREKQAIEAAIKAAGAATVDNQLEPRQQ